MVPLSTEKAERWGICEKTAEKRSYVKKNREKVKKLLKTAVLCEMHRCRKKGSEIVQSAQKKRGSFAGERGGQKALRWVCLVNLIYLLKNMRKIRTKSDEILRGARTKRIFLGETP